MLIMAKRITLVLDDDIIKKLRTIQAKRIQTETTAVSFSKVINEILKKSIK